TSYKYIHVYAWITQDNPVRVQAQYDKNPDGRTSVIIPKAPRGYALYEVTLDRPDSGHTEPGPNNELRIYFANLGDSGTNAQMAALRVDLNNNPERDEYAVFTHEGAVRLKSLVPVDDVYPGLNANGQLGETTYLVDGTDIIVTAAEPDWVDNTEDGGGTWTTREIEGLLDEVESGTAEPGQAVAVDAAAEHDDSPEADTDWNHQHAVDPDPDPDPEPE